AAGSGPTGSHTSRSVYRRLPHVANRGASRRVATRRKHPSGCRSFGLLRPVRGAVARSSAVSMAALVLDWFPAAARDLPWRRPGTTPWGVLVSEFMLQQTPVSRV